MYNNQNNLSNNLLTSSARESEPGIQQINVPTHFNSAHAKSGGMDYPEAEPVMAMPAGNVRIAEGQRMNTGMSPHGMMVGQTVQRKRSDMKSLINSQKLNKKKIIAYTAELKALNKQIDELKAKNDPSYQIVLERKMAVLGEYQFMIEQQELITKEIEYLNEQELQKEKNRLQKQNQQKRMNSPAKPVRGGYNRPQPQAQQQQATLRNLQNEVNQLKAQERRRKKQQEDEMALACCLVCCWAATEAAVRA